MKQKLLYFILSMLFSTTFATAQDHVWDFGLNSGGYWLDYAQIATGSETVDGLTLNAISSSFGGMRDIPSATTWADDPGYTPIQEWTGNGSSSGTPELPARRYFSFPVTGPATITVWFRVNGTGGRTCYISDGTTVLGQGTNEVSTDGLKITGTYSGPGAGTIYISANASINYHKIEVATVLGLDDKASPVSTNVKAIGDRIYVSNVKTSTEINIYSITGALVKSFKTATDTDFSFKTGLWIASVKTVEGQKAVKLVTQ
jgi:hypothetical protein